MTTMPATVQERFSLPGPPMRPGGASAGFGPADIFRIIKQRLFLIIFLWMFFIGLTVAGTALAAKYFPLYEASALLLVEQQLGEDPLNIIRLADTTDAVNRFLKDQAAFIKSQSVLERALLDVEVKSSAWYREIEEADMRVKALNDDLVVLPREGTSLIQIMMRTKNQSDPHRIVNAVVTSYLALLEERTKADYRTRVDETARDSDLAKQAVTQKLEDIQEFIDEINQPGVVVGVNFLAGQIQEMDKVLAQLKVQKEQYRGLWDSYNAVNPGELAISPQMRQLVENDPQVYQLANQKRGLEAERRLRMMEFGPEHRYVTEINNRLANIEQELNALREIRLREIQQYQRDQTYLAYLNAQNAELSMREKYEDLLAQQRDLDRQLAHYNTLQTELRILEEKAERLDQMHTELRQFLNRQSTINVRRYADASPPIERFFPNWFINVPVGAFLGLALSMGFALLIELVNNRVRSPMDVTRHAHMTVLGTVPDVDDEEVDIEEPEKAVMEKPQSMMAEAFKIIRTNLFFSAPADRQRTLMLTSPKPEDGTTTIAVNLAATIAQSARRVLLVDANLRRPAVGPLFGSQNGAGLSNVLIGQKSLSEVCRPTSLPNLDVLPSGPVPPNPGELLSSPQMQDLIAEASTRYDQVIFDSPPVTVYSDPLVLASLVDGVILVIRAHQSHRGVVNRARTLLERVNARLFGATLNAAQSRRGGYFREQFRTFYDYQPEPSELESDSDKKKKAKKSLPAATVDEDAPESMEDVGDHAGDGDELPDNRDA